MKVYRHGSFRDPSGYLVREKGILYREITTYYRRDYDALIESGLYDSLTDEELIIPHTEVSPLYAVDSNHYKTIKPEEIPFISYPYEWCFSQLKDAALLTLTILKKSLDHDMVLKDASAYNVQFYNGKAIFIDTLSFEQYEEGTPWIGYRQFCQHFIAPLALMSMRDFRLVRLLSTYIDGIPLDLTSRLLPLRTWLRFPLLLHVHLHAKSQAKYADAKNMPTTRKKMSKQRLLGFIDSLERLTKKFVWKTAQTEWRDYYDQTNYSDAAFEEKKRVVRSFIDRFKPESIWDLGANTGEFSRVAKGNGARIVSFDVDPAAVEMNYLRAKKEGETNILPLIQDLTNPSPGIGWIHEERESLLQRGSADMCLALALIHHLAISNNVPLSEVARLFSSMASNLIIEFVPKEDSQVKRLLSTRRDIFDSYDTRGFEEAFENKFTILEKKNLPESSRVLYLLERKQEP